MVQKLLLLLLLSIYGFESSVVLDGTKTDFLTGDALPSFESSVVLDGTKT